MRLTKHFTLEELVASETAARLGIDNTPTTAILENLVDLAKGLEKIRLELGGRPIHINSGYRCAELNTKIGGAMSSLHLRGLAADIICPSFGSPLAVCRAIAAAKLNTDQVIHEFGHWCHVSFVGRGESGRGDLLTIASAKRGYEYGLVPI